MISVYRLYTFLLLLVFTIFGVLKPIDLLPDMQTYKDYFDAIRSNSLVLVDVSYILLSRLVIVFSDSFRWVILFYVSVSLYVKFYSFQFFQNKNVIVLMYLSSLLILHEFIQIRIALALSFLIIAVIVSQASKAKSYIFLLLAVFFHASAVVFVVFFILSKMLNNRRLFALIFITFFVFISFYLQNILNLIASVHSNYVLDKIVIYINASTHMSDVVNVFSLRMLVLYFVLFLFTIKIFKISNIDFVIYFSIVCTVVAAIGLKSIPDISFRLVDVSIFFSIFLISSLSIYYSKKMLYFTVVLFLMSSFHYNLKLLDYVSK